MVNQKDKISPEQMSHLLYMVTLATRRTFTSEEGSVWLHMLSDYTYDECHEAFTIYIKTRSEDYLTPGLITNIIRVKGRERWVKQGDSMTPPNGLNGEDYLDWLKKRKEKVTQPPKAPVPTSTRGITTKGNSERPAIGQ